MLNLFFCKCAVASNITKCFGNTFKLLQHPRKNDPETFPKRCRKKVTNNVEQIVREVTFGLQVGSQEGGVNTKNLVFSTPPPVGPRVTKGWPGGPPKCKKVAKITKNPIQRCPKGLKTTPTITKHVDHV